MGGGSCLPLASRPLPSPPLATAGLTSDVRLPQESRRVAHKGFIICDSSIACPAVAPGSQGLVVGGRGWLPGTPLTPSSALFFIFPKGGRRPGEDPKMKTQRHHRHNRPILFLPAHGLWPPVGFSARRKGWRLAMVTVGCLLFADGGGTKEDIQRLALPWVERARGGPGEDRGVGLPAHSPPGQPPLSSRPP